MFADEDGTFLLTRMEKKGVALYRKNIGGMIGNFFFLKKSPAIPMDVMTKARRKRTEMPNCRKSLSKEKFVIKGGAGSAKIH